MNCIGKLKTKSSVEIGRTRVGVGFECLDRALFSPERCYDLAAATGAQLVRTQTGWARCERERGVYDFAWLDDIVDNLRARGMIPWFNVGYGNPIYMPDAKNETAVGCVPLLYGEEVLAAWKRYLTALAAHFKGRITHFEIWNEPDLAAFWYPEKSNPSQLAELISLSGAVIREVIPEAKIGSCASQSRPEFVYTMLCGLRPDELDFFCPHNYDRFPERSMRARRIRLLRHMMDKMGFGKTELWMGECGHASWHPVGHTQCKAGGGNEHRQAVWHLRRYFHDLADGLAMTSVYQIVDLWEKAYQTAITTQKKPAAQGILNGITYTPKKAYETMACAAAVLSGECIPCEPFALVEGYAGDEEIVTVSFTRNGKPVMAYWLGTAVEREEQIESCSIVLSPLMKLKDAVLIDMYTGVVSVPPATLKDLPLREYPILLTEKDTYETA